MLSRAENELLTRVEGGAPMGQMIRRAWLPATTSDRVVAGGAPIRVRLLGENLVVFRNADGSVGALDENCPHRAASLALAHNDGSGSLKCIYHGWRIDCDGTIVEMPSEPEDSTFRLRVKHVAYPCSDRGGLIWVYLGHPDSAPPLPKFPWLDADPESRLVVSAIADCNWVQSLEGALDSAHTNVLHGDNLAASVGGKARSTYEDGGNYLRRPSLDPRPRLKVETTDYGFRYAAIRQPAERPDLYDYARISVFLLPFYAFFPAPAGMEQVQIFVPIDDTHTLFQHVRWRVDGTTISAQERERHEARGGLRPGIDIDANLVKVRNRDNLWLQDREKMKAGSFTGIDGIHNQDMAVQESMGPVVDRSREHLGASDAAIIRLRRVLLDTVRAFDPQASAPTEAADWTWLRAVESLIDKDSDWRELMTAQRIREGSG